ncbi:hypothetical protein MKW98_022578 [Papaver atlanticum]|uniref:Uncharacterized protein n=1 Tax=Papaver atlanticum TaxID=357466 RepID=A0AAD4SMD5_9MAGN|nr:hypothetical protein MKW98_022578 [Papaver atlanticum]
MKSLQIEQLMDQQVKNLSGESDKELHYVFVLVRSPADIYLIDEPSAYLDSEQRIVASKGDCVWGTPSIESTANAPQSLLTGMNLFLFQLDITFRRDPTNFRPRINKLESTKDKEKKAVGTFYYLN